MRSVESDGATIDDAIARALSALGARRDQVEIDILANASRGLFGIGRTRARVRATIRAPLHNVLGAATAEEGRDPQSNDAPDPLSGATDHEAVAAQRESTTRLREILAHMKLDAAVSEAGPMAGGCALEVVGRDAADVVGRGGEVLDALEYLLNRMIERSGHTNHRVSLDAGGHRARRRASLEALAHRLAEQVRKRRKPVTLKPMSPADRRTIHLALESEQGVTARSHGEGLFRKLVIVPGGRKGGGQASE